MTRAKKIFYIILSVLIYILAVISLLMIITIVFAIFAVPVIILMNILALVIVLIKYRYNPQLSLDNNKNDKVMFYLCKIGGCFSIATIVAMISHAVINDAAEEISLHLICMFTHLYFTPSVKKSVAKLQKKNSLHTVDETTDMNNVEQQTKIKESKHLDKGTYMKRIKNNYSNINTAIPIIIVILLYIIPIRRHQDSMYPHDVEYHYLYDYNDGDRFLMYMIIIMAVIVLLNWTYKVFHLSQRMLFVITLVLYLLFIITILYCFSTVSFYYLMITPILFAVCMLVITKKLIDEDLMNN